jgi:hypothetical protein
MESLIDPQLLCRRSENVMVHLGFSEYLFGEAHPFSMMDFKKKTWQSKRKET